MAVEAQVYEALRAAIQRQLDGMRVPTSVLDADEHQGVGAQHVQLGLSARYTITERAGSDSLTAYRADTRAVAHTASDTRELRRRVEVALRDAFVTVGDEQTSPIERETDDRPAPDNGMFSALTTWTFTI